MVTSASVPQKVLLENAAVALRKEPDPLEDTDSDDFGTFSADAALHVGSEGITEAFHTALYLRNILLSMNNILSITPTADDLLTEDSVVPNSLYNFIFWILCGDQGRDSGNNLSLQERIAPSDAETHRHVLSICQDIMPYHTERAMQPIRYKDYSYSITYSHPRYHTTSTLTHTVHHQLSSALWSTRRQDE